MRNDFLRAGGALGSFLIHAALVLSQAPGTGAIQGSVIDPSGYPLPNVSVTVENEATHLSRSVITNASELFPAAMLPPGEYRSSVKADGFAENKMGAIPVVVGEKSTIQFRLRIATVDTTLEVKAHAEMADTQSSCLGRAVDVDMAAEKTILVSESQSVHLRAEFFNLTDKPNFANPGNGAILGSSGPPFGLITGKWNNPRIVEAALK
jgi:hypothetical protein